MLSISVSTCIRIICLTAVWKTFFTEKNGPGVALYEVDFGPSAEHSACVDNFVSQHPGICDGIYLVSLPMQMMAVSTI